MERKAWVQIENLMAGYRRINRVRVWILKIYIRRILLQFLPLVANHILGTAARGKPPVKKNDNHVQPKRWKKIRLGLKIKQQFRSG